MSPSQPLTDSVYTGYAHPEDKAITITSFGNSAATISSVTVDSASFVIGSISTVPAGGSISTWTVRPAAGLSAGVYTATVTVTYDGSATATAQVSFTVTQRPSSGGGSSSRPTRPPEPFGPSSGNSIGWDDITDEIADPQKKEEIVIDMGGETEVPGEVLDNLAGKDVDVTFELEGGFSWTVSGQDVTAGTNFSSVNLGGAWAPEASR